MSVTEAPVAVAVDTLIRPGPCCAAPTVVMPTRTRSSPNTSAVGTSVPRPFCSGTAMPSAASTCAADATASGRS
jgi:hypothetical protein